MSRIYGCVVVVHCYKEDVLNETLEDQITVIMLGSVHSACIIQNTNVFILCYDLWFYDMRFYQFNNHLIALYVGVFITHHVICICSALVYF